jgi:predicted acylesterase/phospholipase RssA
MLIDSINNPGMTLTQSIRVTSAAPGYFSSAMHNGKEYLDGGIGNNNPTRLFLRHANRIIAPSQGRGKPGCLQLSL